jgi:hypothetical protein
MDKHSKLPAEAGWRRAFFAVGLGVAVTPAAGADVSAHAVERARGGPGRSWRERQGPVSGHEAYPDSDDGYRSPLSAR